MHKALLSVICGFLACVGAGAAELEATTSDGRRVLLREDQTWMFLEDGEDAVDEGHAELRVSQVFAYPNICKLGLKLINHTPTRIRSLVPQFSAYTPDGILFETVSAGFASIKPTNYQYREIQFRGIECREIDYVLVHGADRCAMGSLDKFSLAKGACLKRVRVVASDLITIRK